MANVTEKVIGTGFEINFEFSAISCVRILTNKWSVVYKQLEIMCDKHSNEHLNQYDKFLFYKFKLTTTCINFYSITNGL